MHETIGWIAAICFASCGVPQAYKTFRLKQAYDMAWSFLLLWFVGELLMIIYICLIPEPMYPLLFNYMINFVCLLIILRYKAWPIKDYND